MTKHAKTHLCANVLAHCNQSNAQHGDGLLRRIVQLDSLGLVILLLLRVIRMGKPFLINKTYLFILVFACIVMLRADMQKALNLQHISGTRISANIDQRRGHTAKRFRQRSNTLDKHFTTFLCAYNTIISSVNYHL